MCAFLSYLFPREKSISAVDHAGDAPMDEILAYLEPTPLLLSLFC